MYEHRHSLAFFVYFWPLFAAGPIFPVHGSSPISSVSSVANLFLMQTTISLDSLEDPKKHVSTLVSSTNYSRYCLYLALPGRPAAVFNFSLAHTIR